MESKEIRKLITQSIHQQNWHWFQYHFNRAGTLDKWSYKEHPISKSIVESCYECEQRMPNYAKNFIAKLVSYSNHEKSIEHYDQILQHLAELLVVAHLSKTLNKEWTFREEPKANGSEKNPEISISRDNLTILVEVKSPRFSEFQTKRIESGVQLPARINKEFKKMGKKLCGQLPSLPRDNVVKDFLISANEKFEYFKKEDSNVLTVLVIVWDDFIYEPITSLVNEFTGLLTPNSYYKNNGIIEKFHNIDNIIILRNMTQIANATKDIQVSDGLEHPLDYGKKGQTLSKALLTVNKNSTSSILEEIFQCEQLEKLQKFADYRPQEFIIWV